jgi:2-iminoacetate synthase ThiH
MSSWVDRAIEDAGLGEIAAARRAGDADRVRLLARQLEKADLLALGALADRVRADEVGDVVRVYANTHAEAASDVVAVTAVKGQGARGTDTLRKVAIARIAGPRGARVRIDWGDTGMELAQVALGFGASELVGPIANRRGLPIADDAKKKVKGAGMVAVQALKKKELEELLARAGRTAVFVDGAADPAAPLAAAEGGVTEEAPHVG